MEDLELLRWQYSPKCYEDSMQSPSNPRSLYCTDGKVDPKIHIGDFPGGAVVKNPPAKAGVTGSSPGPGRSHMLRSD